MIERLLPLIELYIELNGDELERVGGKTTRCLLLINGCIKKRAKKLNEPTKLEQRSKRVEKHAICLRLKTTNLLTYREQETRYSELRARAGSRKVTQQSHNSSFFSLSLSLSQSHPQSYKCAQCELPTSSSSSISGLPTFSISNSIELKLS